MKMDLSKLTEMAYEAYRISLAGEGRRVPIWNTLTAKDQEAWLHAIQVVVNASLWEVRV